MSSLELALPELRPSQWLSLQHEYDRFDGRGGNTSPQLQWQGLPEGTRSLALTLFDPDAPTGSGFWHWVAFDLPPTLDGLPVAAGSPSVATLESGGLQARNDFGHHGYGGPCPPVGAQPHRYQFTLHALDTERLGVDAETPNAIVRYLVHSRSLASAQVIALYGR
ncbi:YbhB/YbcL family Raf kinase inhibitor-like protein [Aquabacterium sp. A7-Y]|uniref:YbhB/YbcL family Raf kinase inhibitor-like protein n=1 Tax=Aquabacterium sp. A7-Y TaxID=1349605 RepID=UPI00223D7BD3|nr:YbhB/YbcL family Raf kinase inhibitor-like protein [Aquabacterium sp. A7-Y]MCW7538195.1 YbhB/YbcL family Raf kinase inhibitor-like protein [Aquabacterium sp. A7-Y]